jgi:hypothetical protein
MSQQMIESVAAAQLAERRESAARLRLRKQARAESRPVRRQAASAASAGHHSILSRLHLRSHPAGTGD